MAVAMCQIQQTIAYSSCTTIWENFRKARSSIALGLSEDSSKLMRGAPRMLKSFSKICESKISEPASSTCWSPG